MHHGEIAIRIAELLDRIGFLFLGRLPGSVTARVRTIGSASTLIHVTVGGRRFEVVVRGRAPRRCPCPVILKFPE